MTRIFPARAVDRSIAIGALAATAGCGYIGASPWVILAGATMIASLRSQAHFAFADKYAVELGPAPAWALFAGVSIAANALWCAVAFGLGRAIAIVT